MQPHSTIIPFQEYVMLILDAIHKRLFFSLKINIIHLRFPYRKETCKSPFVLDICLDCKKSLKSEAQSYVKLYLHARDHNLYECTFKSSNSWCNKKVEDISIYVYFILSLPKCLAQRHTLVNASS